MLQGFVFSCMCGYDDDVVNAEEESESWSLQLGSRAERLSYIQYIYTHADTHIWREGLLFQCQLWTTRSSIQGLWPWTQYNHISSEVVGFNLVYVLNLNNVLKDVVKKARINDQINKVASFRTLCIKDWVFLSRASFFKILY